MKRLFMSALAAVIFIAIPALINAQEINNEGYPRPYNSVADAVEKAIQAELPDWKHQTVLPLNPNGLNTYSQEVLIDQWSSQEGSVRIVIFLHSSEAEAKDAFGKFTAGVKANEHQPDIDKEAFAWGLNKSIALRRGSYAVYISSVNFTYSDIDSTAHETKSGAEAKLNKMFAKIVVKALQGM